jgi:hypothetical protein
VRCLVAIFVMAACSRNEAPPPAPEKGSAAVARSFVPEAALAQLGNATSVFAADVRKLRSLRSGTQLETFPCLQELADTAGVVVLGFGDSFVGLLSNVSEATTKKCIDAFAPRFNATVHQAGAGYELVAATKRYSFAWVGFTLKISEVGNPAQGSLGPELRSLIAKVPHDAHAWFASLSFFTAGKTVAWLHLDAEAFRVTVTSQGTREVVTSTFDDIAGGLRDYAIDKGAEYDEAWVRRSIGETSGTIVLTIPLSVMLAPR